MTWKPTPENTHIEGLIVYVYMETREDVPQVEESDKEPGVDYPTPQREPKVWGAYYPDDDPEAPLSPMGGYPGIIMAVQDIRRMNGVTDLMEIQFTTKRHLEDLKSLGQAVAM